MEQQEQNPRTSLKQRWTQEELEKLKEIHDQQLSRGGKTNLWNRVWKRVNASVRKACRQAIEYKWKNYIAQGQKVQNRIKDNEELKEIILREVPHKGFLGLTRDQPFNAMTEPNLKNVFYSTVRTIAKWINNIDAKEEFKQCVAILSDRTFLQILAEKGIDLVKLRRSTNELKAVLNRMRSDRGLKGNELEEVTRLREEIMFDFSMIKNLYHSCILPKSPKNILEEEEEEEEAAFPEDLNEDVGEANENASQINESRFEALPSLVSLQAEPQKNSSISLEAGNTKKFSMKQMSLQDNDFLRVSSSNRSFNWEL